MDIIHNDKCRYEIQEQKKLWYGIPEYTDPFRTLISTFLDLHDVYILRTVRPY
jgi:hypothetical protein